MNSQKLIFKALDKYMVSSGKRAVRKKAPPVIKQGVFDMVDEQRGEFFTAGFGKEVMLPDDIMKRKYYIAGYNSNNPAKGVIDPQYAHALWLDDNSGRGGVLMISLDAVGLLNKDVNTLKQGLADFVRITGCRNINVFCTHNHAGIDTMGIWGRLPLSGRDPKFMRIVFDAAKSAAFKAYEDRREGSLYYGSIEVPDMQEDIRLPEVYSKALTRLRFVPNDGTREIFWLNFASHSESLQGCNSLVSADFPCYLRERIRQTEGVETLYGVGAIGGMISMKIDNEQLLRKENRLLESTRSIGRRLGEYALSITDEKKLTPKINFIRQEYMCQADNPVLALACRAGILKADRYGCRQASRKWALKTEMTYYEIDSLKILFLPCEIFPELVYGGYLNAEESAQGRSHEINPTPLVEIAGDENLLVFGLANDELGYVLPPNDFLLDRDAPYLNRAVDRLGRRHYEETNSLGPKTAANIADNFSKIMKIVEESKKEYSVK